MGLYANFTQKYQINLGEFEGPYWPTPETMVSFTRGVRPNMTCFRWVNMIQIQTDHRRIIENWAVSHGKSKMCRYFATKNRSTQKIS